MKVFFLEPVLKDYIWGGTNLITKFNKKTKYSKVAESWEVSANKNGKSIIRNGEFKGSTLDELFDNKDIKEKVFGINSLKLNEFPVLIKFIDANNNLSVQVHPDDEYARKHENSQGKSEVWYIMDCKEGAKLVCGLNTKDKEIKDIVGKDNIEEYLNFVDVKKGDYVYIKSGTVHAILDGILVCEIQQNSDITYRLYDWNRVDKDGKPRKLHINKAIDVINKYNNVEVKHTDVNKDIQNIVKSKEFYIDLININDTYIDETDGTSFYAYNVIVGEGMLEIGEDKYSLNFGESFIIPACIGKYTITGKIKLLKTFI